MVFCVGHVAAMPCYGAFFRRILVMFLGGVKGVLPGLTKEPRACSMHCSLKQWMQKRKSPGA